MKHHYRDIRERIEDPPLWWDEMGVPRYCVFTHHETNDIYVSEAVLMRIACQACGYQFDVCLAHDPLWEAPGSKSLAERITDGTIHYGDPPNMGCCPAGPTMNSEPIAVLQYWYRGSGVEWERRGEYEGPVKSRDGA